MIQTLPEGELGELRAAAHYISGLPPVDMLVEIMQLRLTDPKTADYIREKFKWLGKSLDAYFGDLSDPVPESGLTETMQKIIQDQSNTYRLFSSLIFEGERFLKQEAEALGIHYPFTKRSDLLKIFALEECQYEIFVSLQNHWESHSEAQRNDRLRICQKYCGDELSKSSYENQLERWKKEDAKIHRDPRLALRAMPWRHFCLYVFQKYRRQLPAFNTLVETLGVPKGKHGKFTIVNGCFQKSPKRGKSKPQTS